MEIDIDIMYIIWSSIRRIGWCCSDWINDEWLTDSELKLHEGGSFFFYQVGSI